MAAISLYKTRKIFNNFNNEDYTAFINRLNPIYKLFRALLFLKRLLDKGYDDVQGQFQIILDKYTYFNYIM